jgi:FtsZ-binding cell division protein ZapB
MIPTMSEINEAMQQALDAMKAAQIEIIYLREENKKLQQILGFSIEKGEINA